MILIALHIVSDRVQMRAREGDLIESVNGLIFDVKGLIHPPNRVVAFPRFIPDPHGNRKRNKIHYKKIYALSKRYKLLEERYPQYLVFDLIFGELLCEVPKKDINHHYDPVDRVQKLSDGSKLDKLEADALRFIEFLYDQSGVPWSKIGISGSLLAQLHTIKSDIDPIVYGKSNCLKVYETIKSALKDNKSALKAYTQKDLENLYSFRLRDTNMSLDDFVATEHRKVLQGKFLYQDFFIRCIKDWNEIEENYGDVIYRKAGYARVKAVISDNSNAIFTPCHYSVENVQVLEGKPGEAVEEIASFRGRFCEQARKGETVIAQGKVEKVQKKNGNIFFRLLLGSKQSDFMILKR